MPFHYKITPKKLFIMTSYTNKTFMLRGNQDFRNHKTPKKKFFNNIEPAYNFLTQGKFIASLLPSHSAKYSLVSSAYTKTFSIDCQLSRLCGLHSKQIHQVCRVQ